MSTPPQWSLLLRKAIFILLLAVVATVLVLVLMQKGAWTIPDEAKQVKNPLQPSPLLLQQAREIYENKCADCHGQAGKGDGREAPTYQPHPTNFTDAQKMNAVSDGELYYKITHGRRPMPGYKKKLTDQQRWELVLLIRSFANAESAGQ